MGSSGRVGARNLDLGNPTGSEFEEVTVRVDPEEADIGALLDFVNIDRRRVLEIGSGDGRLTWRYADRAAHVTAVEPFAPAVAHAEDNLPPELVRRVVLRRAAFGEFAAETASSTFDVAIFSWSLCCLDPRRHGPRPRGGASPTQAQWHSH